MVAEKTECSDNVEMEMHIGRQQSIENCASKCKGKASMFIFGTKDYGKDERCFDNGCECYCEISATPQGTCDIVHHKGYRLYKYNTGNYHILHNKNVNHNIIVLIKLFVTKFWLNLLIFRYL